MPEHIPLAQRNPLFAAAPDQGVNPCFNITSTMPTKLRRFGELSGAGFHRLVLLFINTVTY